mmetsp:Transcript_23832/g.31024  ORF Transcript_23832/g.31024 Transcript_23832/m.31024 type:complete len:93 (+) Transcript_23832:31-309(+)
MMKDDDNPEVLFVARFHRARSRDWSRSKIRTNSQKISERAAAEINGPHDTYSDFIRGQLSREWLREQALQGICNEHYFEADRLKHISWPSNK